MKKLRKEPVPEVVMFFVTWLGACLATIVLAWIAILFTGLVPSDVSKGTKVAMLVAGGFVGFMTALLRSFDHADEAARRRFLPRSHEDGCMCDRCVTPDERVD